MINIRILFWPQFIHIGNKLYSSLVRRYVLSMSLLSMRITQQFGGHIPS